MKTYIHILICIHTCMHARNYRFHTYVRAHQPRGAANHQMRQVRLVALSQPNSMRSSALIVAASARWSGARSCAYHNDRIVTQRALHRRAAANGVTRLADHQPRAFRAAAAAAEEVHQSRRPLGELAKQVRILSVPRQHSIRCAPLSSKLLWRAYGARP